MIGRYLLFRGWWRRHGLWQRYNENGRYTVCFSTAHALLLTLKLEGGVPVPNWMFRLAMKYSYGRGVKHLNLYHAPSITGPGRRTGRNKPGLSPSDTGG